MSEHRGPCSCCSILTDLIAELRATVHDGYSARDVADRAEARLREVQGE